MHAEKVVAYAAAVVCTSVGDMITMVGFLFKESWKGTKLDLGHTQWFELWHLRLLEGAFSNET
jgi:hypothetical protein